jgi:deoxyribonuclease-4
MKIGLKVYGSKELTKLNRIVNEFDYLEIMALEENDYNKISDFGLPIMIHSLHSRFGINFANPNKKLKNKQSLDFSIKLANRFDSKFIIVHPEFKENNDCSEKQAIDFLNEYKDDRILVENMPGPRNNKINFGDTVKSISHICKQSNKSLCLDIGHAALTAQCLGFDPIEYIKKLNNLNPKLYHLCDVKLCALQDHLDISTGDLNWQKIITKILPKDAWASLETSYDNPKTKIHELQTLRNLI